MKAVCLIFALRIIFVGGSDVVCDAASCKVDHLGQPDSDSTRLLQVKTNVIVDEDDEMDEDDEFLDIVDEADDQKNQKSDINFRLYDLRDDSTSYETFCYDRLQEIVVSHSTPTKISIHGNGGGLDTDLMFADAYVSAQQDVNLIGVDWRPLSGSAHSRTKLAGAAVADMIADLIARKQSSLKDIHVICFSWGCQVAGYASWYLKKKNILISRLTATDPGRIMFDRQVADKRISFDDAQLVDVIHSNTKKLGWQWPVGHVDFYPNGGDGLFKKGKKADDDSNHKVAPVLFAQSIKNREAYPAYRCEGDAHDASSWASYISDKDKWDKKKKQWKIGALDKGKCQMDDKAVYMGEGLDVKARHGFYYLKAGKEGYEDWVNNRYIKNKKERVGKKDDKCKKV